MPLPGGPELIVLLLIVLIVFGAGKLPEIGGALGRGIREFRSATSEQHATPPPNRDEFLKNLSDEEVKALIAEKARQESQAKT